MSVKRPVRHASSPCDLHNLPVEGADRVELRKSLFGPLLTRLYALTGALAPLPISLGFRTLRRGILRLVLRLEGGDFWSATARHIMKSYHGVTIGSYSYGCFDPDRIPPNVSIGRYVSIGPGVRVFPHDHPLDRLSTHPFFYNSNLGYVTEDTIDNGRMVIGNDTWIGANAIIVAGCRRIGDGAVIGAGSVVTRDIDDFQIVAGVPAKPLRRRFPDAFAQRIKRSPWWSRSMEDIAVDMDAMIKPIVGHSVDHPLLPSIRDHLSEPDRMEETV